MGHKRHYSHESDHQTKSSDPKAPTTRSKSYPRDERHRKRSNERRERRHHKHESEKTEYSVDSSSKKLRKEKKKHEKIEKDKYNTERYLKEKHTKYQPNQEHIKQNDKPKHSYKAKESIPKPGSLLDLMNIEYFVTPMQVMQNKENFRSQSGGEKRSKERDQLRILNKGHSKSQGNCKQRDERKHSKSHAKPPQELSSSIRRSLREKCDRKHRNKDKYSSKTGSSRKSYLRKPSPDPLYSGLYKFFCMEKSLDSREVDQVKHNVSSRNNSDEVLPEKNESSSHRPQHGRDKRKQKEKFQKKSEEDMKHYFLKIQNLIDEKLNTFFLSATNKPSICPQVKPSNQEGDCHREREKKNRKKTKEICRRISPKVMKIPIITTVEEEQMIKRENFVNIHNVQEEAFKNESSNDPQKTLNEVKSDENTEHLPPPRNNISDCSPKRSKISVNNNVTKTPEKATRTLECKTVSIVSIIPQERIKRIGKVNIESPNDATEAIVEKKKKYKRFKKYYNYGTEKQIDSDGNSSAGKSILSDSFKNVQSTEDSKELPAIYAHPTEEGQILNLHDTNLPPYWTNRSENIWRPHGIFQACDTELTRLLPRNPPDFNWMNFKIKELPTESQIINRSPREDDGFIKVYSNRRLKCRESSSDSLVSKSSFKSMDHTKVNVKLILGPHQATKDGTQLLKNDTFNQDYRGKAIDYLELKKDFVFNQQAGDRMSRIEKLLNDTLHLEESLRDSTLAKHRPATYTLPKTFISKLLEEVSERKTSEIGVGTNTESTDDIKGNEETTPQEKTWSHFSVQADLLNNEYSSRNPLDPVENSSKTTRDVGVDTMTLCQEQTIFNEANEPNNNVKDQYAQISRNHSWFVEGKKKSIKFQMSTRSLGISTSLPFLGEHRRTNIKTGKSDSVRVTADTNESTVTSLICLHRFHGDKISSSNKSNSHSLNDYFIKPLISNSPRRSSLFLTKQYRTSDQSAYQKRKNYDEKLRRRMKRKCQHNKEFSPPVFEVRFVTVENTSSQSNPFSSSKEVTRDYVHPTFEETVEKTKRKQGLKKPYSRNLFSCAIRDVDMLWKSRRKRMQKEKEKKYLTSLVEQATETVENKTDSCVGNSENVADLKGVIDFICKSLVTYYHNANFRDRSKERSSGKLKSRKTLEALYYSDHFQKESNSSISSFTDIECRSSVSDTKYTGSTNLTSTSSQKCACFDNNSCPTLNSADSFFDYPYRTEKNINPTILGYALDNKAPPTESYKKKESGNDVSLSEESGYASDRVNKNDLAKEFFKQPNIAALLRPNTDRKTFTHLFYYQADVPKRLHQNSNDRNEKRSGIDTTQINENYSDSTLEGKSWLQTFNSDCTVSFHNVNDNVSSRNILKKAQNAKEDYNVVANHLECVKSQNYLNYLSTNHKSFFGNSLAAQDVSACSTQKWRCKLAKEDLNHQKYKNSKMEQIASTINLSTTNVDNIEWTNDGKKVYQSSVVDLQQHPMATQTDQVTLGTVEPEDNDVFLEEASNYNQLFLEDPRSENISNKFNTEISVPEIMNVERLKRGQNIQCSKNAIRKSVNCLCCKTSSTEDQLFAMIERDLREIYEPTSPRTKQNSKSSIKSKCKKLFDIFFGSERKRIRNPVYQK